jgi:hypothetical protein
LKKQISELNASIKSLKVEIQQKDAPSDNTKISISVVKPQPKKNLPLVPLDKVLEPNIDEKEVENLLNSPESSIKKYIYYKFMQKHKCMHFNPDTQTISVLIQSKNELIWMKRNKTDIIVRLVLDAIFEMNEIYGKESFKWQVWLQTNRLNHVTDKNWKQNETFKKILAQTEETFTPDFKI